MLIKMGQRKGDVNIRDEGGKSSRKALIEKARSNGFQDTSTRICL